MTDREKFVEFFRSYKIELTDIGAVDHCLPPDHVVLYLGEEEVLAAGLQTVKMGCDYPPAFAFDSEGKLLGIGSIV